MTDEEKTENIAHRIRSSLQNRELWMRRLILMVADMLVVTAAGIFTLWARFEFDWGAIDPEFITTYFQHLPLLLAAMLIIFWFFRLYHSLWEFAGMQEVLSVPLACVVLMVAEYLMIELIWGGYFPHSYFPLCLLCNSWGIIAVRFAYRMIRSWHVRRQKEAEYRSHMESAKSSGYASATTDISSAGITSGTGDTKCIGDKANIGDKAGIRSANNAGNGNEAMDGKNAENTQQAMRGTAEKDERTKRLGRKGKDRVNGVSSTPSRRRIMVIGAGQAGAMIIKEIQGSSFTKGTICCVIDDDERKRGTYIHGVRVVGDREAIHRNVDRYQIDQIIIAMPSQSKKTVREILDICKETSCDLKVLPGMYQIVNDEVSIKDLRDVDINDLLGREPVAIDNESVCQYVTGKIILVTGGGGSIGSELCRQISDRHPKQLIILDIYENNAYDIQQELLTRHPDMNLTVLIGSVRNTSRVEDILSTYKPEIIYHAAAHKHVPLMEDSPNEAIKNNVMGTMKLAQAADKWGVKKFVLISTDKAVNPTNIMGASKRLCEMIIQAYNRHSATDFVAVRFGNVLGSNGSVIPLFKKQIAAGGPVTVTDPEIIRYFMTIPEAVSLVLQAGVYAKGGEIFVLDMGEPVKILDLAKNLIRLSGLRLGEDIDIIFTGLRPGEKLYEELLMAEEGLQDTPNSMIHIGEPIDIDDEKFFQELYVLKTAAEDERKDIRKLVAQMVPTYQYSEEEGDADKVKKRESGQEAGQVTEQEKEQATGQEAQEKEQAIEQEAQEKELTKGQNAKPTAVQMPKQKIELRPDLMPDQRSEKSSEAENEAKAER